MNTGFFMPEGVKPALKLKGKCEECCQEKDAPLAQETEPDPQSEDWEIEQPPYYHRDIF